MTQAKSKAQPENQTDAEATVEMPFCGIIMPISAMGPYEKTHWDRVRLVLDEAITAAGYRPRLVSESEDIGVIHSRIVQNIHDDPIVVCDVSGKNANVMFELGLRLAFDKPTIVIIDNQTDYSFDTSPIEHIKYRADLRYDDVRALQKRVTEVILATIDRKAKNPDYSPFIGHFGKFKIAGLDTTTVDSNQFVIQQLKEIQGELERISRKTEASTSQTDNIKIGTNKITEAVIKNLASSLITIGAYDINTQDGLANFYSALFKELRERRVQFSEIEAMNIASKVISQLNERKTGVFG